MAPTLDCAGRSPVLIDAVTREFENGYPSHYQLAKLTDNPNFDNQTVRVHARSANCFTVHDCVEPFLGFTGVGIHGALGEG